MTEPQDESLELPAALAALASFQGLTQQADAKANMLVAVQLGIAALTLAQAELLTADFTTLRTAVAIAYLVAFIAGGIAIVRAMWPRVGLYPAANPFSVPIHHDLPTMVVPSNSHSRQAWEVAQAVAVIARRKNRFVMEAILWVALSVGSCAVWFLLALLGF
ncbi:hypothetical protein LWF15_32940 [Kineosporia rhizophila]|uniref:hypothetical protein n=1 Tax=Kineosporia TaxID=49184 RepID=UPI000AA7989A|nr:MULTISPECIES: hypothetical protein [Kineosporia]MCE0540311.1 hypothetical protein [Kineosporia rhizophila]GLY16322.1 hypothetical protein Kisp01_33370 [Kineosporia sp. NBRC 101677]